MPPREDLALKNAQFQFMKLNGKQLNAKPATQGLLPALFKSKLFRAGTAFFLYLVGSGIAADRPIHAWNKYFRQIPRAARNGAKTKTSQRFGKSQRLNRKLAKDRISSTQLLFCGSEWARKRR